MWVQRGRKRGKASKAGSKPPVGPVEARAGAHEWIWSKELHCLVCKWCGEAESMSLSKSCPAVLIRDRDGQVFQTRLLEEEQTPSIVDGVGFVDTEIGLV